MTPVWSRTMPKQPTQRSMSSQPLGRHRSPHPDISEHSDRSISYIEKRLVEYDPLVRKLLRLAHPKLNGMLLHAGIHLTNCKHVFNGWTLIGHTINIWQQPEKLRGHNIDKCQK